MRVLELEPGLYLKVLKDPLGVVFGDGYKPVPTKLGFNFETTNSLNEAIIQYQSYSITPELKIIYPNAQFKFIKVTLCDTKGTIMNGKGDKQRPTNMKKYRSNFDEIFSKQKKKVGTRLTIRKNKKK